MPDCKNFLFPTENHALMPTVLLSQAPQHVNFLLSKKKILLGSKVPSLFNSNDAVDVVSNRLVRPRGVANEHSATRARGSYASLAPLRAEYVRPSISRPCS